VRVSSLPRGKKGGTKGKGGRKAKAGATVY